ncbi:MAG: hypothetical protein CEE41_05295 [Hadesarchaea archaeon B3_Hades]|nr:MAG: hypothetical protein CEE41_05295 [Hadesarchaea archaeon B3_Hades]
MSPAPKTLTADECHLLLEALHSRDGTPKQQRRGIRNNTIALCMLDAGLRVGEVVRLYVCDLWFNKVPVKAIDLGADVGEKGCCRLVPLTQRLSEAVELMSINYWTDLVNPGTCRAFYTSNPNKSLTTRQIERTIGSAAIKSLGRSINPHVLRHTFATRLMRKTNARVVQQLLGHKRLSSTQIYMHPDQQDLASAIDTLNEPDTQ